MIIRKIRDELNYIVVAFEWSELQGRREMKIDKNDKGVINLSLEGIKDIHRLCEEYLNKVNLGHDYLQMESR